MPRCTAQSRAIALSDLKALSAYDKGHVTDAALQPHRVPARVSRFAAPSTRTVQHRGLSLAAPPKPRLCPADAPRHPDGRDSLGAAEPRSPSRVEALPADIRASISQSSATKVRVLVDQWVIAAVEGADIARVCKQVPHRVRARLEAF